MSLFTESSWETDAVGDKLVKEFSKKKKKKAKKTSNSKSKSGSFVSDEQYKEACKNIKAVAASIATSNTKLGAKKRKSDSLAPTETTQKKSKKFKSSVDNANVKTSTKLKKKNENHAKQSNESRASDASSEKKLSSRTKKSVIGDKSTKKVQDARKNVSNTSSGREASSETKSQRKRRKMKLKKNASVLRLNDATPANTVAESSVKESSTKSFDVRRIEKLLALKEKNASAKSKMVKEPESLRERMMAQLRASRFRFLNETLYNNESSESKKYFKEDPDAFAAYHSGYRQQVEQWPLNPLDVVISSINKMSKDLVIADFGCGEARLAESVPQKVHSFDLVAVNDKVKACDMAHTPLLTNGVNVVVFCLSLMGTNLADYLLEANRVLKKDGILKIADVESRFENVDEFIQQLENYGFANTWKDLSHNLFHFMDFKKVAEVNRKTKKLPEIALKPCVYKKR